MQANGAVNIFIWIIVALVALIVIFKLLEHI